MSDAKRIIVKPIVSKDANKIVRSVHYSGKVVNNSQVHLGVFLDGRCGGAMQFGPSLDKRKLMPLVSGTKWNEFIELNRMAFADWLPRNSESRAIGFAMRWLKRNYRWLKWVVSFADATQCGDGTIYRASGFVLTGIKQNTQIWEAPTGEVFNDTSIRPGIGGERERAMCVFSRMSLTDGRSKQQQRQAKSIVSRMTQTKAKNILDTGASSMRVFKDAGWRPKPGFQIRYVYFLDPSCRSLLTVPEIPFSEIHRRGASMYRGTKRAGSKDSVASADQAEEGGASPTSALQ